MFMIEKLKRDNHIRLVVFDREMACSTKGRFIDWPTRYTEDYCFEIETDKHNIELPNNGPGISSMQWCFDLANNYIERSSVERMVFCVPLIANNYSPQWR